MNLAFYILASYAVIRFIIEDASLKNVHVKINNYLTEEKFRLESKFVKFRRIKKIFIHALHRFISWPYWLAILIVPIVFTVNDSYLKFLAVVGAIYLIYDVRPN